MGEESATSTSATGASISVPQPTRRGNVGIRSGTKILRNNAPGKIIAKFRSLKLEKTVGVDSLPEWDYCFRAEYSRGVKCFKAQALVLHYDHEGKRRRTTPDFVLDFGQGLHHLIEVKSQRKADEPAFKELVVSRQIAAESLGYTYTVVTDKEIREEPVLSNLKLIYRYARFGWRTDPVELLRLVALPATLGDLQEQLDSTALDITAVFAAIQRRYLLVDLSKPIDASTPVHLDREP